MSEPKIIKESIIARSPKGQAVLSWDSEADARRYMESRPAINVTYHKQTITEEKIDLLIS